MNKLLIKNARIVTSERIYFSDILAEAGKITYISENIEKKTDYDILDAEKKYVFPGGIDPHVHMHLPTFAGYSADDFYTGSKAALLGGTTTLIDFVTPKKNQPLPDALAERKREAENCLTDFTFHVSPIDFHKNIENEIRECIDRGITSFKVYTAYLDSIGLKDTDLLKIMEIVAEAGALLTVHAELGNDIEKLRNQYFKEGKVNPEYHALSRPPETEFKAVEKIINYAEQTGCKVYFVHVSTGKSAEIIKSAQKKALPVFAETCPQYLLLEDSKLKGKFKDTAKYVFSPPLRKKTDNENLWNALSGSVIQTVGTDHCPFNYSQKLLGENDFRKIPNGAGGVEHRLSLLYTYGVLESKISLNDFVKISSTNSSKIFGLYPQKGEIAVGSDADLIIWQNTDEIISIKTHNQSCDLNIYENIEIKGKPETVIKNGKIIFSDGTFSDNISNGEFLKRKL